jgi:hypothetical protein
MIEAHGIPIRKLPLLESNLGEDWDPSLFKLAER